MDGRWERKLATRDTNRVVRPFEWGTDWLHSRLSLLPVRRQRQCARLRGRVRDRRAGDSDRFYSYHVPRDYRLQEAG